MTNEEALEVLEKRIACEYTPFEKCRGNDCKKCEHYADMETFFAAVKKAAEVMREFVEGKSPCAVCGYGGKHLDAPPCTGCPAYPKEVLGHGTQGRQER